MKKRLLYVGALLTTVLVNAQQKQDSTKLEQLKEVVVTATKFALKKEQTGKVIYKISSEDIKNNAGRSVIELLNELPDIEIKGTNSSAGEIRSTFIRGGRSRQVLVLIDGVPVSDPTGVNQEFDLRLLSLSQIETIEVLKGASSTLYGSGAATGVINIILKKAAKKPIALQYEASLGTNVSSKGGSFSLSEKKQSLTINGTPGKLNYLAYFNLFSSDGISAAKSKDANQVFDNDPYHSKNGLLKLGYSFNDNIKLETFMNYDALDYSYDAGAYNDSDINNGNQEQIRFGIKPSFKYNGGELFIIASINKIDRTLNSFNSFANAINTFGYIGESINLDAVNKFSFANDKFQLITGINYQKHNNETKSDFGNIDKDVANFNTVDPYASVVYISDFGLNINLGGRLNMHSNYGNHFVYDANVSYNFLNSNDANLKALASYSSAFIAPSLYQLYSQFGNLDLNPETSKTIEAGLESSFSKWLAVNVVYFNRNEDESIIFKNLNVAPWRIYDNAETSINVSGIEADVTVKPIEKVELNIGYTFTDKDANTDYIPKNKFVANLKVAPFDTTYFSILYKSVDERTYFDDFGSFGTSGDNVVLPSYGLLDFNINHKVLKNRVMLFATVSNIFNEDYEETLGFTTRGRNLKLGLRLGF